MLILVEIDAEYTRHPFYGSRKMVMYLRGNGHLINRKRVQRLMGILGLAGMAPGPNTSSPHPQNKIYPYLLRGVSVTHPNQVWSTVKVDRNGLQFFWRHVLKLDWQWVNIIKPPKVTTIPDILTLAEVERIIGATRKLRYRVFFLTTYSLGLRLEETLSLQVGDIDAQRRRVHVRRGK